MDYSLISVRYAKALYSLSTDKGITKKVNADMCLIDEQFRKTQELGDFLNSSVVSSAQKKELFKNVFGAYLDIVTMKFLSMLVDNKREGMLTYIARDYSAMFKDEQNIKSVSLYTATQLDDNYLEEVKAFLIKELKSDIELNVIVREHLIGGFLLMLDGKLIDTSVSTKLKQFKKQLLS